MTSLREREKKRRKEKKKEKEIDATVEDINGRPQGLETTSILLFAKGPKMKYLSGISRHVSN